MCNEAKNIASDSIINGNKIYTIHNTTLKIPWKIHEDEEKTKYSWKVLKILLFEYKYSNRIKSIRILCYEYMKIGTQIQYSNTKYSGKKLVFEYLQLYCFGIRIHIRILEKAKYSHDNVPESKNSGQTQKILNETAFGFGGFFSV
jgi:hypothetical protein